ncbi:PREDICTED: uncharacterized protein LOC109129283 [Camelina sativa]|uniref:Uncharacterized protein LOC109129283 n=1 Tax=Camelina sativa TaxID=90675 RepID=A0ABM1R0X1_CAMSA|nr:PREDICTED: uncharacterized protein LOC109129283 [Camelina sativa]
MNCLVAFLLIITLSFKFNEAFRDCEILFQNQLGPGTNLTVSCESNKEDRKEGAVKFNGTPVRINFREAVFERTLWFCLLQHGAYSQYYRAYRGRIPIPRFGEKRLYIARPDGIYLSKNANPELFDQPWKKN